MVSDPLDTVIASALQRHSMPGLALGLVGANMDDIRCYGFADKEAIRPVASDTIFRIGSVSKTITALAIMQLRDAGKLDLDDPVTDHLRHVGVRSDPAGPAITIRHLLTHKSGLGALRTLSDALHIRSMAAVGISAGMTAPLPAEYYRKELRAAGPAGVKWSYANHAFGVLGAIVEDVSGSDFNSHVRGSVLEPFGMRDTHFRRADVDPARFARGYRLRRGKIVPATDIDVVIPAAGSGFSTAADLCRYAAALLATWRGDDELVIASQTLREMCQPQLGRPDGTADQGLPFFLSRFDDRRVAWHSGAWPGFSTLFAFVPDSGVAVVALSNRYQASGVAGNDAVATAALRVLLKSRRAKSTSMAEDPQEWGALVGRYTPPPSLKSNINSFLSLGNEVQVRARRGSLWLRSLRGPLSVGVRMRRVAPNHYEFEPPEHFAEALGHRLGGTEPVRIVFESAPDGAMRLRGLDLFELVRRERGWGLVALRRQKRR